MLTASCLNPLHCGAVVASREVAARQEAEERVSIPFIAGQWSLPFACKPQTAVATAVSIPFIAGQWSLLDNIATFAIDFDKSQSPSLRGSGRFHPPKEGGECVGDRLNPLHCGAVVAWGPGPPRRQNRVVSIPFIAGQWSLAAMMAWGNDAPASLNPLHCGAVVASGDIRWLWDRLFSVSIPFIAGQWSLPGGGGGPPGRFLLVSIPFIAGQWSLLQALRLADNGDARVSIPFIAGQWSLRGDVPRGGGGRSCVSIPFIAGQWSLPERARRIEHQLEGLNPLHCGAVVASGVPRVLQP